MAQNVQKISLKKVEKFKLNLKFHQSHQCVTKVTLAPETSITVHCMKS